MRRVDKIRRRIEKAGAARAVAAPRLELRRGGVYALPDGTELVAVPSPDGSYLLYHPLVWAGRPGLGRQYTYLLRGYGGGAHPHVHRAADSLAH